MWSNVISIDKGLDKEAEYLLERVRDVKNLSYAVEESRDRIWIYLASICEVAEDVEEKIISLVETVILTYLKLRYFEENLNNLHLTHSNCALISALVHFDRQYEGNLVRKAIGETSDFNVDGLYHFRLRPVLKNWEELATLAERLMSSAGGEDVFDIAAFITSTEGARSRLAVKGGRLINLTERQPVEILPLFEDDEYNLISAIIKERPCEILVEDALSEPVTATLKHIARVIYK